MFESSDESWKGPVEDKNLFLVWKRINSRVEKKISSMTSAQNNDNQLTDTESRESISNDENLEPNDEAKFTGNLDLDSFSFPIIIDVQDEIVNISDVNDCDNRIEQENPVIEESCTHETDRQLEEAKLVIDSTNTLNSDLHIKQTDSALSNNKTHPHEITSVVTNVILHEPVGPISPLSETINENLSDEDHRVSNVIISTTPSPMKKILTTDIKVPTPFKKTLFWPEPKKVTLKKKPKEKIPSVATLSQWQQYFKSKEEKKRKEEEKKVQRQEERKRKKMEVEKRKKNKKSDDIYPEQAIDSDDDRSTR
jgi:hypothetical protein